MYYSQAVEHLRLGVPIKRESWAPGQFLFFGEIKTFSVIENQFEFSDKKPIHLYPCLFLVNESDEGYIISPGRFTNPEDFVATDWVIHRFPKEEIPSDEQDQG